MSYSDHPNFNFLRNESGWTQSGRPRASPYAWYQALFNSLRVSNKMTHKKIESDGNMAAVQWSLAQVEVINKHQPSLRPEMDEEACDKIWKLALDEMSADADAFFEKFRAQKAKRNKMEDGDDYELLPAKAKEGDAEGVEDAQQTKTKGGAEAGSHGGQMRHATVDDDDMLD